MSKLSDERFAFASFRAVATDHYFSEEEVLLRNEDD